MIKLEKWEKPAYLSIQKEQELVSAFKRDLSEKAKNKGHKIKSVWNKSSIKKSLLGESHSKCVYCESRVSEKSSYMEVEHFYPKINHPDLVVSWDNLLSSCKKCNGLKGEKVNLDMRQEIINPFIDNPQEHLSFRNNRFRSKDGSEFGDKTIDVFDLNGTDRRISRYELTDKIDEILHNIYHLEDSYKLRNRLLELLRQIQPSEEYSAILSTQVHLSQDYNAVRERLVEANLWTEEHEHLHSTSVKLILDCLD